MAQFFTIRFYFLQNEKKKYFKATELQETLSEDFKNCGPAVEKKQDENKKNVTGIGSFRDITT